MNAKATDSVRRWRGGDGSAAGGRPTAGRELVVAHFRTGRRAARAIRALDEQGVDVEDVYVVAAGEAELLVHIGVAPGEADRIAVVVAAAVAGDAVPACLAVLGAGAEAVGVAA
jgi:hypothetical protein